MTGAGRSAVVEDFLMPRPARIRNPEVSFHVTNRALGRRLAFDSDADRRLFLSLLAKAVKNFGLRVSSFSLLGTHFHLFARSVPGDLANAMQFLLGDYSRAFNARRDRDGPLWGRRYHARPVTTRIYARNVVGYIDLNPVRAGLCVSPGAYPFGSARHYLRADGPIWLNREPVERLIVGLSGESYDPKQYGNFFWGPALRRGYDLVEARLAFEGNAPDYLDELVAGGRDRVQAWMLANARQADGVPPHLPVADLASVREVVAAARSVEPDWTYVKVARQACAWRPAEVALLRDLCSFRDAQIGAAMGLVRAQVHRARLDHSRLLESEPHYVARLADLSDAILKTCHGPAS